MKKIYLFLLLSATVAAQMVVANPVDETSARQTALRFMNDKLGGTRGALNTSQLVLVNTDYDHLYIYNLQSGGFIIVSDDDRTVSVLGYSTSGSVDVNDMVPAFANQLNKYNMQLKSIAEGVAVAPHTPHRNTTSVTPLIQTQWKQWSPDGTMYNSMCPIDSSLPVYGYRPTTGCIATSTAQIMRYWQWPLHGRGSNCYFYNYECWNYDTLCADFSLDTYDWANMPSQLDSNSTQAQRDAIGLLLYHCGVAMNMKYNKSCTGGSGISTNNQLFALVNNFKYSSNALLLNRSSYTDAEWIAMVKNELDNGRPIPYSGESLYNPTEGTYSAAHSFIVDGYDENDLVHINWGWGGSYDGYFNIFDLAVRDIYNFSHSENAIFGLQPATGDDDSLFPNLCSDVIMDTNRIQISENIRGRVDIYNPNDTTVSFFMAQAVIENLSQEFVKWIDVQNLLIPAHDTLHYSFDAPVYIPVGSYYTSLYYSTDSIDINETNRRGAMLFPAIYKTEIDFWVVDSNRSSLSNLVIFVRFAGEEEISYPFSSLDSMFNCKAPNYPSVYNYFDVSTYGKIHYNTVYDYQVDNNIVHSYEDEHPRGYYQPYSETNPIGYHGANPLTGISMREAELLAAAMDYVNENELIDYYTTLDGDGDGYIDNISFIVKGERGEWASILWPHMEFFPQDSIDHLVTINGVRPKIFNFGLEGSGHNSLSVNVFRHEMSHSLGLPDLYHYVNFLDVDITGNWDVMCNNRVMNQNAMIYKSLYLHVADEPIEITEDGTYTLYSNATSESQSCYIIKSAIDSAQWYTFEYRNKEDLFDEGIPGTGLIIGRWNNHIPHDMYANMFFDYDSILHQYWIFRPESTCDTINGDLSNAHFCAATNRTTFGPTTNPRPYLADGTIENSFEITEIQEYGEYLTFHVHFFGTGIEEQTISNGVSVYPNPADNYLTLTGENMLRIEVYNSIGQLLLSETTLDPSHCTISIENLCAGVHIARIINTDGSTSTVKFVKK